MGLLVLFCAAFLLGIGMAQALISAAEAGRRIPSVLETVDGGELLDASLEDVGIAAEMYADAAGRCEARIENKAGNTASARVSILRTATGEVLYESGLIDPGRYVEYIDLSVRLQKGWYPCSVVWEFYEPDSNKPVGKAAQSAVLIVKE